MLFPPTAHLLTFTASALSESVNQGQVILPKQKSNYIALCFHTCYSLCLEYSASSRFSVWQVPAPSPFSARRALGCEDLLALLGGAGCWLSTCPQCSGPAFAVARAARWLTVRLWLSPLMTSPTSERTEWHLSVWGGRKEGRPLLSHRLRTMAKLSFSDTSVPLT